MKFINWIRASFEGSDRLASYRKLSSFVFNALVCYMVLFDKIPVADRLPAIYALLVASFAYAGIITASQLLQFKWGAKKEDK